MALDTENSPRSPSKQRPVLRTRNVCQKPIASAPYTKPTSTYLMGTTLDSNNPAVIRRNARERNRVKQVNNGFYVLRQHIPNTIIAEVSNGRRGIGPGAHKKLSKVDTLRMAAEYIRRLKRLINEVDSSDTSSVSSWESAASSSPAPQFNNPECHQYYSINSTPNTPDYENNSEYAQPQQISPANSVVSSVYSADSYYSDDRHQSPPNQQRLQQQQQQSLTSVSVPSSTPVKFEPIFDDYNFKNNNNNSTDDEELLEYISLWQDE